MQLIQTPKGIFEILPKIFGKAMTFAENPFYVYPSQRQGDNSVNESNQTEYNKFRIIYFMNMRVRFEG
jgi:hypothetical protein